MLRARHRAGHTVGADKMGGLCRCSQASQSLQAVCEVLFEEASRPLLHALRKARSKNIRFSHCALSFGNEAPLRSERCFTSNQTDSTGAPCKENAFPMSSVLTEGYLSTAVRVVLHWQHTSWFCCQKVIPCTEAVKVTLPGLQDGLSQRCMLQSACYSL